MRAAVLLVSLQMLHLTAAWILPPVFPETEMDNETLPANCSVYTYEAWVELKPQPLFIDTVPYAKEEPAEEEEIAYDYEEQSLADTDDNDNADDFFNEKFENRVKRDISSEEDDSSQSVSHRHNFKTSDESDDSSEAKDSEDPYAFLRLKTRRNSEELMHPNEITKVMLKNFKKDRMSFFMTVEPFEENEECGIGSFANQFYFVKLQGCWLEHKHNAHKICKKHNGRKHGHGRHGGRNGSHHDRRHGHHGHGHHGHGRHGHGHHGNGRSNAYHGNERHGHHDSYFGLPSSHDDRMHEVNTDGNSPQDESSLNSSDNAVANATFEFPRHRFMQPANGEAVACGGAVEGWLEPESKIVVSYTPPTCGCIVIKAYVSYDTEHGTHVLTSEGNEAYLQHFDCVQPNPTPEEEDLEEFEEDNNSDDDLDDDGIDTSSVPVDTNTDDDSDEDDMSDGRRDQRQYNLRSRPQQRQRNRDSSEEDDDDDDDDEDSSHRRRLRGRRAPDQMSHPDEEEPLSRQERRRQEKMKRREERREARQQRRQGMNGEGDTPHAEEGGEEHIPTEEEIASTHDPREQRRLMKLRRRAMRRQRGRDQDVNEVEAEGEGGRRGKGRRGQRERGQRRGQRGQADGHGFNKQLLRNLTDPGQRFCCKQGVQHKKASTFPQEGGASLALDCSTLPSEVASFADRKHSIAFGTCTRFYTQCCDRFNIELWKAWTERVESRQDSRRDRRRGRQS